MKQEVLCPQCGSTDVLFSKKRQQYICEDCQHLFTVEAPRLRRRIFVSYGHDEHAGLARRLTTDLKGRGHQVWLDLDRLPPGRDTARTHPALFRLRLHRLPTLALVVSSSTIDL